MGQQTIKGSTELAASIKLRRNELGLTIEEAAARAGVGTKTWSRYEAGESIRKDKCKGICKALNWRIFPSEESAQVDPFRLDEFENHEAWSPYLNEMFGPQAAISFAIGSDLLLDFIQDDLTSLSSLPKGSHLGQIDTSFLITSLPLQFLMRYDYDFLYLLQTTIIHLRMIARAGQPIIAHRVIDELALYLIVEESRSYLELTAGDYDFLQLADDWSEWIFDLFDE